MIKQFLRRFGRQSLQIVHDDDNLRIARLGKGEGARAVLCFTGVGLGMGGVQTEEFVGISQRIGGSSIFVTDKRRTWFNGIDPADLQRRLEPLIDGREVVTLGNSMGAFGAIWATSFLPVASAIAFAPQFSVHPGIVPRETRWREWRDRIEAWHYPDLTRHFTGGARYFTFNGAEDEEHWSHFKSGENQTHVLVPETGHDVAKTFKERGILGDVIADCLAGGDVLRRIESAGLACRRIG